MMASGRFCVAAVRHGPPAIASRDGTAEAEPFAHFRKWPKADLALTLAGCRLLAPLRHARLS